ncbi:MAG TPA: nickel-dependent lactate racemase, partial [Dehalococcoidia bacterium]|nr:nickel-dependent lactate racemase [Dehalococcoidia bacterium]
MKVWLAYGAEGLEVELPEGAHVLLPTQVPPLADPQEAIRRALRQPLGCPPLWKLVHPGDKAAVVFSDITRPIPNHVLLPPLLAELEEAGLRREDILLINATGMHRPNTREELVAMLGPAVVEGYPILQHDAFDRDSQAYRMDNERGVPIYVDRRYLEAQVKILTGFIEPHVFAGWSGGGKAVLPGIAGAEAILSNHSAAMLDHPRATFGTAMENPIFAEMRRVALAASPAFLLNVTLSAQKQITGVFAGELAAAHDAGIAFAREVYLRPVPHRYDIVVASNMGYPADLNLDQAGKGMAAAAQAVKPGGAIVLAAECRDGLGTEHYVHVLSVAQDPHALLEMLRSPGFSHYGQWGVQVQALVMERA